VARRYRGDVPNPPAETTPPTGGEGTGRWDVEGLVADPLPPGWRRHARRAHLDLVARWIGETKGRWLKTDLQEERSAVRSLVPELGGTWLGIDVAATVAKEAAATDVMGSAADVRRLPFRDDAFDGILSTSTLDHFHDVAEIDVSLRELRRVMAPGGRMVLTLDNPENPLILLRNRLPDRSRRATGLVQFHVGPTLSAAAGTAALERSGFEVLAVEHLLHAPHIVGTRAARWSWFERRALPWFDGLAHTRAGRFSGHYVAFLATPSPDAPPDPS
jgi:SAM-dependent methyltransferase